MFIPVCLYLQCYETLKQQKDKLATDTKRLYYCDNIGKMLGRSDWSKDEGWWWWRGIPIPTELHHGK